MSFAYCRFAPVHLVICLLLKNRVALTSCLIKDETRSSEQDIDKNDYQHLAPIITSVFPNSLVRGRHQYLLQVTASPMETLMT